MSNKGIPCSCQSCQDNANDPKYRICPRCKLPQVTNSPLWGDGYCINCMRVTIKKEAQPQADNTQSTAIAQIAARLEQRVKLDRRMDTEEAWQDVVTEAVRQLRAL
jgi:uncharacterized Zn finger protein (UPF0148 family)